MLIHELSARTGASPRSLRYWEAHGLLTPERTPAGYRDYTATDELAAHQVKGLLAAGFDLADIRVILPCARGNEPAIDMCPVVAARMKAALVQIDDRLADLDGRRTRITSLLDTHHLDHGQ